MDMQGNMSSCYSMFISEKVIFQEIKILLLFEIYIWYEIRTYIRTENIMGKIVALINVAFFLFTSGAVTIAQTSDNPAAEHASQTSAHGSQSVMHAIMGTGKVVSAASSVPFAAAGSAGAVSTDIASESNKAASLPVGEPLEIAEETVSAGLPPDQELQNN